MCSGRRKNPKIRNRRKDVEKKVDNGHPRWSLHTIPHKNRKPFHNGRNPEGGGGGRAKRSYNKKIGIRRVSYFFLFFLFFLVLPVAA